MRHTWIAIIAAVCGCYSTMELDQTPEIPVVLEPGKPVVVEHNATLHDCSCWMVEWVEGVPEVTEWETEGACGLDADDAGRRYLWHRGIYSTEPAVAARCRCEDTGLGCAVKRNLYTCDCVVPCNDCTTVGLGHKDIDACALGYAEARDSMPEVAEDCICVWTPLGC